MGDRTRAVFATAGDRPRETWDDPSRGDISWFTLISADRTPTEALSAGVAELRPGGSLALHRHAQPEIYCILAGTGIVTIDGIEKAVTAGTVVFIPGDAEHGIRNEGTELVRLFYVFGTDSFGDVVYRFGKN